MCFCETLTRCAPCLLSDPGQVGSAHVLSDQRSFYQQGRRAADAWLADVVCLLPSKYKMIPTLLYLPPSCRQLLGTLTKKWWSLREENIINQMLINVEYIGILP